jgi:DNA-binding transcriptional MerR regulator
MPDILSTRQAAERLGVPFSTLRQWIATVPIRLDRDVTGSFLIDTAALDTLAMVRDMRAAGRTLREVRDHVNGQVTQQLTAERVSGRSTERDDAASNTVASELIEALLPAMKQAILPTVAQAILEDTQRAERFGQLAHRVGELEAMLRERERELTDVRAQVALLPGPDRLADLERDLALRTQELDQRDREIADLRDRLARRPWFAFWR